MDLADNLIALEIRMLTAPESERTIFEALSAFQARFQNKWEMAFRKFSV
jgi:hypothetical protein